MMSISPFWNSTSEVKVPCLTLRTMSLSTTKGFSHLLQSMSDVLVFGSGVGGSLIEISVVNEVVKSLLIIMFRGVF